SDAGFGLYSGRRTTSRNDFLKKDRETPMKHKGMGRQWKFYSLALSVALGLAPTAMGQRGAYAAIDFPGSTQTLAWAINKAGDIIGSYTIVGVFCVRHVDLFRAGCA